MLLSILLCGLALSSSQPPDCADVASCHQAALDARSSADFERFHDLAWRAAQKGRPNDPELMALLARAQSLSGRPGDALVMLRRLAQMGIATDAATSDDFRRVRALPGWPDVEALLAAAATPPDFANATPATATATRSPATARVPPGDVAPAPASRDKAIESDAPADEALPALLVSIRPAGLAYDAVSRRFIVGDRHENKLVIFDDVFKRATDMVGADSAGFFGVSAIEIDAPRGDLWVANSSATRGASLHKLQLVSGRVLFELAVPLEMGPTAFVDTAILPDGQVLLLDAEGRRLLGLSPAKRAFHRIAAADVEGPTSLAVVNAQVAYVTHREGMLRIDLAGRTATPVRGAPAGLRRIRADRGVLVAVQSAEDGDRIVRLRLDAPGRKVIGLDVLGRSTTLPDPSGMTIADGVVCYIASMDGTPVLRRIRVRR